ncbi:zinc finger protein 16 isoform X3 [Frankliniella occidentalis]|uniref:Zinc finger protein 16 isoform X3 n=1 Tax=Frankliniella occidentalis TaxID=133901 RepID=A0A6J1TJN4_FRAOC|nr:zinc finger protein 16 isoform X3 [Frankliniella occidentalis]
MMEFSISCPLCSQPGFSDVNSLWLSLIRVTTRQLTCPVCLEVLCGLDKLTIHLVSHSLHNQLVSSLASNLSTPPAILSKSMQYHKISQCPETISSQESVPVTTSQPLENSPLSYVFVNIPTLENMSIKERAQASLMSNIEHSVNKEGKPFQSLIEPKTGYPLILMAKPDDSTLAPDDTSQTPLMPQNTMTVVSDPLKLINLPQSREETIHMSALPSQKEISCLLDNINALNHNPPPPLPLHNSSEHGINLTHQTVPVPKLGSPCQVSDLGVPCGICGLTFKDDNIAMLHQQLIHHQSSPDGNNYKIPIKLDDRSHSSKHRSRRTNVANQHVHSSLHRFPCHICNKVFRMRGSLMVHLRVAHSPNGTTGLACQLGGISTALNSPPDVTSKLCLQNLSIQESSCSFTADESIANSGHERRTDNGLILHESTDLMPQSLSPSHKHNQETLLLQHLKSHDSKQWECDVCFKSFTTKYFLKKHKRLHTGEMPYTCGICNKSFTFQQSYHKHLLYHSDEKPHSCSECGRAFKELSTLHNHQRIHTGEKPWACETCGKCFRQRVSYLVHRRIHTGAMPYQCTVCLKSFRYKVSQRTHKCVVQSSGDAASPSNDLLQQLLQSSSKEAETGGGLQTSNQPGQNKSQRPIKEQLPQPNEDHSLLNKDQMDNHFLLKSKDNNLISVSKCQNAGIQPSLMHQLSLDCHNLFHDSQARDFMTLSSVQPPECKVISKVIPNSTVKPDLQLDKSPSTLCESHDNLDSSPLPQSTPPSSSSDFNIDLLQDILSMVMSPSDNVPSPSTQMRHLSLAGGQNDEDLESGLELRQLLYGPCDSDTM